MSRSRRTWRPLIFIPAMVFALLSAALGAATLGIGLNEGAVRCNGRCGVAFSLLKYFSHSTQERVIALLFFATAAMLVYIAMRRGLLDGHQRGVKKEEIQEMTADPSHSSRSRQYRPLRRSQFEIPRMQGFHLRLQVFRVAIIDHHVIG